MALDIQAAIDSFWQAAQRGEYFPADWYDKLDLDAAYRIQLGRHGNGGPHHPSIGLFGSSPKPPI